MGLYGKYLSDPLTKNFAALAAERQSQLKRISALRGGRDVLVIAADLNKDTAQTSIGYIDILPITDQISDLSGTALDLILETPGGSGEVAEDIVRVLRRKYEHIAIIVPGWAKSAGTIIAMAADEILMGQSSSLGPIDAQLTWQGKRFPADALLEGMTKIKQEVDESGVLNKAYIPILQGISPGELQSAQNGIDFATSLATDWLVRYKFKNWKVHSRTNEPVTDEERQRRAKEIAEQLCSLKIWRTHGRSIKADDLRKMGLPITDYSEAPELLDAISRYYTLLLITFSSNLYKIYETPTSQIYKYLSPSVGAPHKRVTELAAHCDGCKSTFKVQVHAGAAQVSAETLAFPLSNKLSCPKCGKAYDLSNARRELDAQARPAAEQLPTLHSSFSMAYEKSEESYGRPVRTESTLSSEANRIEIAEIEGLRQLVLEVNEREETSFTTT